MTKLDRYSPVKSMIKAGVTDKIIRESAACSGLTLINTNNWKKRRADTTPKSKGVNKETNSIGNIMNRRASK